MIDLTLNKEDKDSFITKVYLKDESNKYTINYASGRVEEVDFTIPKFNETLLKMEEQFLTFRDAYVENATKSYKQAIINQLIEALVAVGSIFCVSNIDMPPVIKVICLMLAIIGSAVYQKSQEGIIKESKAGINVVITAEEFLKHKDDFKITITDPQTSQKESWYLITLSEIETLYDAKFVNLFAGAISPEIKEEEGKRITKELQLKMRLG